MTSRRHASQGFTLVELLVTITIMATAMIAIFVGLSSLIRATIVQRSNANIDVVVRAYSEQIASTSYVPCAAAYSSVTLPSGYSTVGPPVVNYWNGDNPATFGSSCTVPTDTGLQQVSTTIREDVSGQRRVVLLGKRS